jgi:hypothetical protein
MPLSQDTAMKSPGRNELCPCGSGRKYKQCCLGNAEPAMTEKGRLAHVHNATRRAVYERVTAWSARELGRDWLEQSLDAFHEMAPLAGSAKAARCLCASGGR